MSSINTNIPSLVAARLLNRNNDLLSRTLERLSTGYRINRGSDDPAGLIASETLRGEKTAIQASIDNANRAKNVLGVAEGALTEVNNLLIELEGLVDRSASPSGISDDEVKANQLQIDSVLDTINRIASTTTFAGRKLLDGSLAYTTSAATSVASSIADITVNAARLADGTTRAVTVDVTGSAQTGTITYSGGTVGAAGVSISVGGNKGVDTFSFASGTTASQIATAVAAAKDLTGVSASVNGANVEFNSTRYGSDQFVTVEALQGTFTTDSTSDYGQDPTVLINGGSADADGLEVTYRTATLDVNLTLTAEFATQEITGSKQFDITDGGAKFRITPDLSLAGQVDVGLRSVTAASLGNETVGRLSTLGSGQTNDLSSGNYTTAQEIVREASSQVASLRGRLGAIQSDTLDSTVNSLQIAFENVSAAESSIRDTDFAAETSNLTRAQILVQTATSALGLANAAPQNVLSLLR